MPEIKSSQNPINKDTKPSIKGIDPSQMNPSAKPEAQFVLPQRRGYSKFLIIPVGLIVLLGAAWIAYTAFSKPASAPAVETQQVVEKKPATVQSDTRYYLASDSEFTEARVYQYSEKGDEKIGTIKQKNLFIAGKYTEPYTYVVNSNDGKLQILDATTAKLEPLLDLEDPTAVVRDVALSGDKKLLAYARNYEGSEKNKPGGEIWTYNVETKEKKQIVKRTELGIYQGFSILGWRNDDKELIVSALGGDAGAVWGDIYQVTIATGKIDVVNPVEEKDKVGFITGVLSPDSNLWLFEYCADVDEVAQEKDGENFFAVPCASGTELHTYNFGTKDIKTVYQNLRYDNNVDKSMLRTFMSEVWQDDKTIIAAVPGAILSIPLGSPDKATELVTYDRYNPQNFKNNYVNLIEANDKQLVYTRAESWFVFDRDSQKIIDLNAEARKESINSWLN